MFGLTVAQIIGVGIGILGTGGVVGTWNGTPIVLALLNAWKGKSTLNLPKELLDMLPQLIAQTAESKPVSVAKIPTAEEIKKNPAVLVSWIMSLSKQPTISDLEKVIKQPHVDTGDVLDLPHLLRCAQAVAGANPDCIISIKIIDPTNVNVTMSPREEKSVVNAS